MSFHVNLWEGTGFPVEVLVPCALQAVRRPWESEKTSIGAHELSTIVDSCAKKHLGVSKHQWLKFRPEIVGFLL